MAAARVISLSLLQQVCRQPAAADQGSCLCLSAYHLDSSAVGCQLAAALNAVWYTYGLLTCRDKVPAVQVAAMVEVGCRHAAPEAMQAHGKLAAASPVVICAH